MKNIVKQKIKKFSIADHDSIDAYTKEFISLVKENNINLIPGIEISSKLDKLSVHVLGYNFDLNNVNFKNKINELKKS